MMNKITGKDIETVWIDEVIVETSSVEQLTDEDKQNRKLPPFTITIIGKTKDPEYKE